MTAARGSFILAFLSTWFAPWEIEELYHYFHSLSKEEILEEFSERLREPKRLSISTCSSILSIISDASSTSTSSIVTRNSAAYIASVNDAAPHLGNGPEPEYRDSPSSSATPKTTVYTPGETGTEPPRGLPPSSANLRPKVLHVCITCRKCYDSKSLLSRHRTDICECRGLYVCPECPEARKQKFARLEKLKEHFDTKHKCGRDCDWNDTRAPCPRHPASFNEQAVFQRYPPKLAWGCPICDKCFESRGAWQDHEATHHDDCGPREQDSTNIAVGGWSRNTRIRSLLSSKHLQTPASNYGWRNCSWEHLSTKDYNSLTFALERFAVAQLFKNHHLPANIPPGDAIIHYTYQVSRPGNSNSALNQSTYRNGRMIYMPNPSSPVPSSSRTPVLDHGLPASSQHPQSDTSTAEQAFQFQESNEAAFTFPMPPGRSTSGFLPTMVAGSDSQSTAQLLQTRNETVRDIGKSQSREFFETHSNRADDLPYANHCAAPYSSVASVPAQPMAPPTSNIGDFDGSSSSWLDLEGRTSCDDDVYGYGNPPPTGASGTVGVSIDEPVLLEYPLTRLNTSSNNAAQAAHNNFDAFLQNLGRNEDARMSWAYDLTTAYHIPPAGSNAPAGRSGHPENQQS